MLQFAGVTQFQMGDIYRDTVNNVGLTSSHQISWINTDQKKDKKT